MGATTENLQADVVDGIRRYFETEQPSPEATLLLRSIARKMVDAREQFTLKDGSPDWRGRSKDYRDWIGDAFTQAGVEDRHSLQSALRYHTGLILRERLRADELAEHGFIAKSPREQMNERRAQMAEIYNFVTGTAPISDAEGRKQAAAIIQHLIKRVERGSSDAQRKNFWTQIHDM